MIHAKFDALHACLGYPVRPHSPYVPSGGVAFGVQHDFSDTEDDFSQLLLMFENIYVNT